MKNELTQEEIDYIIDYTGLDIAVENPMNYTPVVFFTRNKNVIDFVTILTRELNKF